MNKQLGLFLLASSLGASVYAQTPGKVYSTNCENSSALHGSPWSQVTPPYDYYCKVDPNSMIAGNTVTIFFGADLTSGNQTWSVTAYKGGSSTSDRFSSVVTSSSSNNRGMTVYTASNIAGGEDTFDIRLTGGSLNGYWQPLIIETDNTGSVDASHCNTGSSTSLSAGALSTTVANDLIIQGSYYPGLSYGTAAQSSAYTAGSGWTIWYEGLGDGAAGQYEIDSSTGSITPTITAASSQSFVTCAVAYKAATGGGASSNHVIDAQRDAMPHSGANPWKMAANIVGHTVIVSYLSNDAPNPTSCCAISSTPSLTWTQSGPEGCQNTNPENCSMVYCAHSTSAIGPITMSINRTATGSDGIFHIYDLDGSVTCNVDYDSGISGGLLTLSGAQNSGTTIDMCAGSGHTADCIIPTLSNDWVVGNFGEYWGTITGLISPTPGAIVDDSAYFTGNTVDGYTQTDENNAFFYGTYGGTTAFTVKTTGVYSGGSSYPANWGGRVAAFKVSGQVPGQPTGLAGTVVAN